jgi:hypothetical protein
MQWIALVGLFAIPFALLQIAVHRLRLTPAIVALMQLAAIFFAVSVLLTWILGLVQEPGSGMILVFMSGLLSMAGVFFLTVALLRLARLHQPAEMDRPTDPDSAADDGFSK